MSVKGNRTDSGVTNICNVSSLHWRRWLGVEHRCLVPFTSLSEIDSHPLTHDGIRCSLPGRRVFKPGRGQRINKVPRFFSEAVWLDQFVVR